MIPRVHPEYGLAEWRAGFFPPRSAVQELERGLAQAFGIREAVLFPYGRSAIYGVLRALDLRGEVVMPAYNCVVVAHAAVRAECAPVFVDCGRDSPNQDIDATIDAVNDRTVAVFPTSIFGHSFDAPDLVEQIRLKNKHALVLMDLAQAFTPRWNGELLATQGDAAILAFGIGKAMTTLFGGAVLTNREDLAQKVREWQSATFAQPHAAHSLKRLVYLVGSWAATTPAATNVIDRIQRSEILSRNIFGRMSQRESIRLPKANQTMLTAREAAIGLAQLPRLNSFVEKRRTVSASYEMVLKRAADYVLPDWEDGATHLLYTVRLNQPARRQHVLRQLADRGVQGGTVLDYVVPLLACYRELGYRDEYPHARDWAARVVNLPNHPSLTEFQIERIATALDEAIQVPSPEAAAKPSHVREPIS